MTAAVILSFDQYRPDANGIVAPQYNGPMYLRNRMINVDQIIPEHRVYKHIKSIYPQVDLDPSSQPFQICWGSYDYINAAPDLGPYLAFAPTDDGYKLDFITSGRFLDMRLLFEDPIYDVKISALDMEFETTGKR